MVGLARASGVSLDWLANGEGPMHSEDEHLGGEEIDRDMLRDVMAAIEMIIEDEQRPMEPTLKADLTLAMYDYYMDKEGEAWKPGDTAKIIRLFKDKTNTLGGINELPEGKKRRG